MAMELNTTSGLLEHLRKSRQIPVGVADQGVSEKAREDGNAVQGSVPASLPALQYSRSRRVTKIMKPRGASAIGDTPSQFEEV